MFSRYGTTFPEYVVQEDGIMHNDKHICPYLKVHSITQEMAKERKFHQQPTMMRGTEPLILPLELRIYIFM